MILSRKVISRRTYTGLLNRLRQKVGRKRSTIAYTAAQLGQSGIPQWISRHFDTSLSSGKAIHDAGGLTNYESPVMVFGSRAVGIERDAGIFASAVETRKHKIASRIKRILAGYAEDAKAGRKIRKQARQTQSD